MENEQKEKVFFSISMPVHNAEKYLDEAIASVINQEYDNYELILVNDNSSDHSEEICAAWKAKYPDRIKIVNNQIRGSLFARRECIHHSKGDYLYIMDSDDYLVDTSALKKWNEVIKKTGCDLIIFNETNECKKVFDNTPYANGKVIEGEDLILIYNAILTSRGINVIWDKVFKSDLVDASDDVYIKNSFLSHGTDFFQCCEILTNARRIYYLNERMYYYRVTPGSITHRYNPNMLRSAESINNRRREISIKWDYKPDNLEEKLQISALVEYCTVINKLKSSTLSYKEIEDVLRRIGSREDYIKSYDAKKNLPGIKRIVLTMIHLGLYKPAAMMLKMIK